MSEQKWSRGDWLALSGVLISAVSALAALIVLPGIRERIGVDGAASASTTAASAGTSAPATASASASATAAINAAAASAAPAPTAPSDAPSASATFTRPPACTSFEACVASCEAGAAVSCAASGDMARGGTDGATKDPARAYGFYDRACKGDELWGCVGRGWLELNGEGTAKNTEAALASFTRACDTSSIAGCFGLGVILRGGHGVSADTDRASAAFKRACDAGNRAACKALDQLTKR